MFEYYQNLGFNNPYYFVKQDKFIIEAKLEKLLARYEEEKRIDSVAVVEVLNKNFPLADRTVIQNINKTPWLGKPNKDFNAWHFASIPIHDKITDKPQVIARNFFDLICEEILEYTKNKETVGLLLSGGMDSRMVAGALDYLIKSNKVDLKIVGLTWGNPNTRDVVYAQQIAKLLGWEWKHFIVGPQDLLNNIHETGIRGCEYSPIHLHAIPQIKKTMDLDVILAGSYGDSIGRAEYGGIHVQKLPQLNSTIHNIANLVNNEVFNSSLNLIQEDIDNYHQLFPAEEPYMQNEFDYQLHYMRRQLNPCMEILNENSNFYQIFTSPNTFRYIWSIDPSLRNDSLYKIMLTFFKTDLSEIPWARTGLKYGEKKGVVDQFSNRHHSYVQIMNNDILDQMKEYALSDEIKNIGVFNYSSIEELFKLTKKYPINSFYYTEKLAWLSSLAILIDHFKIKSSKLIDEQTNKMRRKTRIEYLPRYYRNKLGGYLRRMNIIK